MVPVAAGPGHQDLALPGTPPVMVLGEYQGLFWMLLHHHGHLEHHEKQGC